MSKIFKLTTHAKHDSAHCLTPNLFVTIKRGTRDGTKLDLTYQHNQEQKIRFTCFQALDATDMKMLQALVALGAIQATALELNSPLTDLGETLVSLLDPTDNVKSESSSIIKIKLGKLLQECGLQNGGGNRNVAIESLRRLSAVTVFVTIKNIEWSSHLLSYRFDSVKDEYVVALNPRLSSAILGRTKKYTTIDMNQARGLKSDVASILHQRLSAVIDENKERKLKLDTLLDYVWAPPTKGVKSSALISKQKSKLIKALDDITYVGGWKYTFEGGDVFKILRDASIHKAIPPQKPEKTKVLTV